MYFLKIRLKYRNVAKLLYDSVDIHPGSDVHGKLDMIASNPAIGAVRIMHSLVSNFHQENVCEQIERVVGSVSLPAENKTAIDLVLQTHIMSLMHSSPEDQLGFLKSACKSIQPKLSLGLLCSDSSSVLSKLQLVELVSAQLPQSLVPRKNRLVELIDQAISFQETTCVFHTHLSPNFSLFHDHHCPRFPLMKETFRLEGHRDEIWVVSISHSGKFIASASKDTTICVWSFAHTVAPLAVLTGHTGAVGCVQWSPDDEYILSGSADTSVKLWSQKDCMRTFSKHTDTVSGVSWLCGDKFFSGSADKSVVLWTLVGVQLATWRFQGKVQDIDLIPGWLVVASSERNVQLIDLTGEDKWFDEPVCLPERFPITSLCSAHTSPHVLVNISTLPPRIHLWNLATRRMEQRYVGHQQGRFIVRASFGGHKEQFVLCGSEDGKIFVWSKIFGALLQTFDAHPAVVNSVVYHCQNDTLVSASDDRTVRIWSR